LQRVGVGRQELVGQQNHGFHALRTKTIN
jgi:hypothetical protein